MKKTFHTLMCFMLVNAVYSQNAAQKGKQGNLVDNRKQQDSLLKANKAVLKQVRDSTLKYRDSMLLVIDTQGIDPDKFFSPEAFSFYMEKAFTQVNFNRLNVAEGNAASLKFEDGDTKMNVSIAARKKLWNYTLGTTVQVTDKTGTLFSKDKPTTGTQFNIGISRLLRKASCLKFEGVVQDLIPTLRKITLDSIVNIYAVQQPMQFEVVLAEREDLEKQIHAKKNALEGLLNTKGVTQPDSIVKVRKEYLELLDKQNKNNMLLKSLLANSSGPVYNKRFAKAAGKVDIASMIDAGGIYDYWLNWLSFQGGYKQKTYAVYNDNLKFDERVSKKNADIWTGQVSYNIYWQRTPYGIERRGKSFLSSAYLSFVYGISTGNSYDLLDETTLNVITEREQNDTVYQFVTSGKYRDVTKVGFAKNVVHKPGLQFSSSFGPKQFIGLNVSLAGEFSKTTKPIFNYHTGLLFHFNDVDDEKSKVNFEIFLSFKDMTDVKEIGGSVWKRKEIGITANVPFNKVFFN